MNPASIKFIITLFGLHPPPPLPFSQVTQSVVTKPLEGFIAFMASHDYKEPENGGKYGATGKNDDEEKGGDDDDDDEGGGEEEDDDEDEEDEDDEDDE